MHSFVSQVDLDITQSVTADCPHAEFGLDFNILWGLYDSIQFRMDLGSA